MLATQAGVAVENARLYQETQHAQSELRRLEVLDERERIAKELHDGVIQSLFAVGMSLQGAAALANDEGMAARIEGAVEDIDVAIRDLRNYIFGLRPGILADRQLDQALRELGAEFESRSGVVTVVDVDPTVAAELSSVASDVVQLTREALSNVGRHAEATTCRVSLRRRVGGAVLEIDDDGRGFEPGGAPTGLGLPNLAERVAVPRRILRDPEPDRRRHRRPSAPPALAVRFLATSLTQTTYCTTSAVTMPYMPCGPSTWGRMWQWNAQAPGYTACTSTSNR